jgi:hypothetical protein
MAGIGNDTAEARRVFRARSTIALPSPGMRAAPRGGTRAQHSARRAPDNRPRRAVIHRDD